MVKVLVANRFTTGILIVVYLLLSSCTVGDEQSAVQIGDIAPPFVVEDVNGNKVSISDYKGKVLLLDFWATWCPPCKDAIPHLNNLQQEFQDTGFTVLGLSIDGKLEPVKKFYDIHSLKYPVLLADPITIRKYGVAQVPTIYLIGPDGRIVYKQLGMDKYQEEYIKNKIESLLENKPKDV